MSDDNPSIISHVSVGTNDLDKATAFYDKVLATIGAKRVEQHPGAVAYGKLFPEFWVQTPYNEQMASPSNGVHIAFFASNKEEVDAFFKAAVEAGATDDGAPGGRPHYGPPYYGCFVIDPDGNKIEATFWDMSLMIERTSTA